MSKVLYRKAKATDFEGILNVLRTCELPYSDLSPTKISYFIVAKIDGKVIGTIGIEPHGMNALLRSMAVLSEFRNKGIASRLLGHSFELANKLRTTTLHLLTTTAEEYFLRKGFKKAERDAAPTDIRETVEFTELCPSSSAYMVSVVTKI